MQVKNSAEHTAELFSVRAPQFTPFFAKSPTKSALISKQSVYSAAHLISEGPEG